ncbi:MAG: 1-acyl-sn-glycerol-3-phosphate acyltransferase [Planctomycetaceae bacterium]|nr:1-acyl-sn-glycerol-3-phosphate acyltransferase [Planctomycetaceae bacterium]
MSRISWQKRSFYYLARIPLNLFFMICYGVRYYGRNNLPESGAVVVIANHQSHFDPPLIAIGLPRRLNFLARKSLFKFKPFGWVIDMLDAIPLDKEGIGFAGIMESLKRLKNGEAILVMPEGERTWDGEIAPFMQGSLVLAQRTKSAILPVAIAGCYEAFPRMQKFPKLWGRFRVVYGKPLLYEEIKDLSEEELRHLCETKVAELYREATNKRRGTH